MARLVIVQGTPQGAVHPLPAYAVVLGRDDVCDIVLDDQRSSRQHACVRLHRDAWWVRDLGSANGTWIGKTRVTDWVGITAGTEFRIGRTVLRLEDDPPPAPAPATVAAAAAPPPGPAVPVPAAPRVGPHIPGLEILDEAGSGATGTVWRARQVSLDRIVAVKVLAKKFRAQPDVIERFVREARAAAALSHPHVVQVFEVGLADGVHYFTMEFMEGGTVEDLLLAAPGSRLPWRECVRIVSAAAKGLAQLHAAGLVHRDVKPANLLLDARREVKLGDLGTLVRADATDGERIGTPHYMSPEQAERQPVSRASDVYSLGATLYRMLAGRTPHSGRDAREIVRNVAAAPPPPVEESCPEIPAEVARLLRSMMARKPEARPADAAELGRRLEETLLDVKESARSRRRARSLRASLSGWVIGLGAAGVFAYAVTHQAEVKELLFPARPAPPSPPGSAGPAAPQKSPAEIAAETYQRIRAREGVLDSLKPANATLWAAIAADYARLAEVFPPDCEPVVRGHWRAKEIRDEMIRAAGGDVSNAAYADRWVDAALAANAPDDGRPRIGEEPTTERPSPATPSATPPGVSAGPVDGTAVVETAWLRTSRQEALDEGEALLAQGRVREALDTVLAWMREQRLAATARRAPSEQHEVIAGCKDWLRRTARNASARVAADLERDRVLLRAHLPASALFVNGVPAHQPAEAAGRLTAVRLLLATQLARDLADRRVAQLRAIARVWPAAPPADSRFVDEVLAGAASAPPAQRADAMWLAIEAGRAESAAGLLGMLADLPDVAAAAKPEIRALLVRPAEAGDELAAWRKRSAGTIAALMPPGPPDPGALVFPPDAAEETLENWGATRSEPK